MPQQRYIERDSCRPSRRSFLADFGNGFASLALGAMLARDGVVRAEGPSEWQPPDGQPHFPPKAKSVVWLFMNGGISQAESFDPKPELTKYAGKSINETPFAEVQNPDKLKLARVTVINDANGQQRNKLVSATSRLSQVRPIWHRDERLGTPRRKLC